MISKGAKHLQALGCCELMMGWAAEMLEDKPRDVFQTTTTARSIGPFSEPILHTTHHAHHSTVYAERLCMCVDLMCCGEGEPIRIPGSHDPKGCGAATVSAPTSHIPSRGSLVVMARADRGIDKTGLGGKRAGKAGFSWFGQHGNRDQQSGSEDVTFPHVCPAPAHIGRTRRKNK